MTCQPANTSPKLKSEKTSFGRLIFSLFALSTLAGCGASEFAPVEGVVFFEGKPVEDATVTFKHEGEGTLSIGTTGTDGSFELTLAGSQEEKGARVGSHQVMISAVQVQQPQRSGVEELGSIAMATAGSPKIKYLIPPRYGDFKTSGLTSEVGGGSGNFAKFELAK